MPGPWRTVAKADDRCLDALDESAIAARYAAVREALQKTTRPSRIYFYAWTHGLFAAGAFQSARGIMDEGRRDKATSAVGALGAFLGFLTLAVRPPPFVAHREVLPAKPEGTLEERRAQLRRAEEAFEFTARQQRFAHSWLQYLGTALWGVAKSLTLWLGFDSGVGAIQLAAGTLVVGGARILTHPRGAANDWRDYRARFPACQEEESGFLFEIAADPGFFGLRVRF